MTAPARTDRDAPTGPLGMLGMAGAFTRGVQHLAPVWVPCVLCAQIALLGLRPALAEQRRLEQVERELLEDGAALLDRNAELARTLTAQRDAIFIARKQRLEMDPKEHATVPGTTAGIRAESDARP